MNSQQAAGRKRPWPSKPVTQNSQQPGPSGAAHNSADLMPVGGFSGQRDNPRGRGNQPTWRSRGTSPGSTRSNAGSRGRGQTQTRGSNAAKFTSWRNNTNQTQSSRTNVFTNQQSMHDNFQNEQNFPMHSMSMNTNMDPSCWSNMSYMPNTPMNTGGRFCVQNFEYNNHVDPGFPPYADPPYTNSNVPMQNQQISHPMSRGMTGNTRGMSDSTRGMTGKSRGMGGNTRGMAGNTRGMSGNSRDMTGNTRGMSGNTRIMNGSTPGMGRGAQCINSNQYPQNQAYYGGFAGNMMYPEPPMYMESHTVGMSGDYFMGPNMAASGNLATPGYIVPEADDWDRSFEEEANIPIPSAEKTTQKKKKPDVNTGPFFVTANVTNVKQWNKMKDNAIHLIFELYGVLDSAVGKHSEGYREFLVKDEQQQSIKCVFYEIDRQLPKVTRGLWYRLVGTYDASKERMLCLAIRPTDDTERKLGQMCTKRSHQHITKLLHTRREQ